MMSGNEMLNNEMNHFFMLLIQIMNGCCISTGFRVGIMIALPLSAKDLVLNVITIHMEEGNNVLLFEYHDCMLV